METTRGHLGWCLYTRNLVSLHKKPCVFTQETLCLYTRNLVFQNISFYSKWPRERNRHTVKPITTAMMGCSRPFGVQVNGTSSTR